MIVLYSNNCPRCKVLKKKLQEKNIPFTENNSVDDMLAIGMTSAPALMVDGELLMFSKAAQWIKNQ